MRRYPIAGSQCCIPARPTIHERLHRGPPMTLGGAVAAKVRMIVWCLDCRHQVEPDPTEQAERYGAETTVPDWHYVDMVVTGERR